MLIYSTYGSWYYRWLQTLLSMPEHKHGLSTTQIKAIEHDGLGRRFVPFFDAICEWECLSPPERAALLEEIADIQREEPFLTFRRGWRRKTRIVKIKAGSFLYRKIYGAGGAGGANGGDAGPSGASTSGI